MHSYRSKKLPIAIGWVSLYAISQFGVASVAFAADPPPVTATSPVTPPATPPKRPEVPTVDAHDVLRAASTQRLLKMPLDLTAQKANVKDIAEQVEKAVTKKLSKGEPAPSIEVRGVRSINLSFAAKDSTVGAILSAAATLSNAKLYSFAGYALIAPESALQPEELAATEKGLGMTWGNSNPSDLGIMAKRKALASFISNEIGGVPQNWGAETSPFAQTKPVNVDQLSSDAKAMLQELVNDSNERSLKNNLRGNGERTFPSNLTSDMQVTLGNGNMGGFRLNIALADGTGRLDWELNGRGFGASFGGGGKAENPSASPAAPLDLSAGKA